ADRNNRGTGLQGEEGDAGASLVQAPVGGTGALRVQRDREPLLQQLALEVEGVERSLAGSAADGDRAEGLEEGLAEPPVGAAAFEVARLREEVQRAGSGDGDRDWVDERQVVAGEDRRAVERAALPALEARTEDQSRQRADQTASECVGESGVTRLRGLCRRRLGLHGLLRGHQRRLLRDSCLHRNATLVPRRSART